MFVNAMDLKGYDNNMLQLTRLFLGQAITFEYMYIYVAISTGGLLVVITTIVVVGCIYKQGIILLKRRYLTWWIRRVSVISFIWHSQNDKTGQLNTI